MSRSYRPVLMHGLRRGLPSKAGFSRRDILRTSLGAATAAALASVGCEVNPPHSAKRQAAGGPMRVAVIGAGFAGLACADTLARGGADVVVLEATGRPGGRVLSNRTFLPGRPVEFGAEFIGRNHPLWIAYAMRFGINLAPAIEYDGDEPILLNGRLIRGEAADQLYTEVDAVTAKLIEMARPIDPVRPWTSPGAARLDRSNFAEFLVSVPIGADARQLLMTIAEADNGVPAERQSMLAQLAMIAGGGFRDYFEVSETHRAAGGNDALASALAKSLGERVRYNCAAVGVHRTKSHAVINTSRGAPVECDAVVIAVPPSVWKKIAFDAPLNGRVPQMGRNVKLITKVQTPVWEQEQLTPEAISDGLVQLTWVSGENAPGLPKCFTLFSGGRRADELRAIDPKSRTARAVESLRSAYPKLDSAVIDDRFIDWPGMQWALASYSFPAPGEVTRYGPTLVDGPRDGLAPLRFAGEHTSYGFIGYMEGALSSGVRAGEQVLRHVPSATRPSEPARAL